MGDDLGLLTDSTASDIVLDKDSDSRPPEVLGNEL